MTDTQTPDQPNDVAQAAKEALLAVQAIRTLQAIVPNWTRRERRELARAIRLRGNGYTKNTGGSHG